MPAYRVLPYSVHTLRQLLVEKAHPVSSVDRKPHIGYLDEYLTKIGVKTVIVEEQYIDKHYVEDYAAYYARCFGEYGRKCARLHFFNREITEAEFNDLLARKSRDVSPLQDCYSGFIVVKPLPKTVIGRTCLKNYSDPGVDRHFPTNQRYDVNLFGFPLHVHSLAFQEQDTDVAACATSALWSAFQATGRLFQHAIPSPVEITRAASSVVRLSNRTMPNNDGLTAEQMADAIRSVGLEPHAIQTGDRNTFNYDPALFRAAAYAYLRGGIPCLCCGALVEISSGRQLGLHAIALTGYRRGAGPMAADQVFRATTIDRLYAHDDAVGPFARLRFGAPTAPILTSWPDATGNPDNVQFIPLILLVPIYHKIRVPFVGVAMNLFELITIIDAARRAGQITSLPDRLEWDVYLSDAGSMKRSLMELPATSFDGEILTGPFPKYVWVADAYCNGVLTAKILFDATDLLQGSHFMTAACYSDAFGTELANYYRATAGIAPPENSITRIMLDWFARVYP